MIKTVKKKKKKEIKNNFRSDLWKTSLKVS